MSFDELASRGERLDGELIGLDGGWYLIRVDGRAYPVAGNATTPFAATTFFDPDIEIAVEKPMTLPDLENRVRDEFPSENYFYAIRVDGTFSQVVTRSVPAKEKPYPRLALVTANQAVFSFKNITGTAVGFWSPGLAKGVNVPGYHLHFITTDRTVGGHILDMTLAEGTVRADTTKNFSVVLPSSSDFPAVDLTVDLGSVE